MDAFFDGPGASVGIRGQIACMLIMLSCWVTPSDADVHRTDATDAALATIKPEAIRADMRFLADDLLEGRGTGERGHAIAAHYVASQFEGMGLLPAGDDGGYLQQVPIRSSRIDEDASSASIRVSAGTQTLQYRRDYLIHGDPGRRTSEVEAPVVFVGYGVTAPAQHYDDYKDIDVTGKIVAVMYGAPDFPVAIKAHYSAGWLKRQTAAAHGAVGYILICDPAYEKLYPFADQVSDLTMPERSWLDGQGNPGSYQPQLKVVAVFSAAGARQLLAGSRHTLDEVYAAVNKHRPLRFALAQAVRFHVETTSADVQSPNVVAKLVGSDPTLATQYVVYTAHLDHLGVGTPVNGDSIYNGALDNASGVAVLLELARAFASMAEKPKRSMLFIAVTGEEAGLVGSDYFARHPTVDKAAMVADINIDGGVMLWPLQDVIAIGAEHSSLEGTAKRAAQKLQLDLSPDPSPEQVLFIRSDQYSFVRQGIPSILLSAGFKSDDPRVNPSKIDQDWEQRIYHRPQDDMQQPGLDFKSSVLFARMTLLCGIYAANDPRAPEWNRNDFFGVAFPRF